MRTRPARSAFAALVSIAVCVAAAPEPCPEPSPEPMAPTPAAGPGTRLTLTETRPAGGRGRWFVAFQEEPPPAAAGAGKTAARSSRGAADIDCGAAQFRIARFAAFEGPTFTGAVLLDLGQRTEWRSPEAGTTMDRVLAAVCGQAKTPVRARAAGDGSTAPDPPRPAQARSSPPPLAEAAPSAAGGAFYAQLASLPSADAARQAWDKLEHAAPEILDERLQRMTVAIVHGRRVYCVLAGGFGTKAEAELICKALVQRSAQCFVRPGGAA